MTTAVLLSYLQNSNPNVPLSTLLGALSHHLSVDLPSPAPLAAATVSSSFFLARPQTFEKLQGLVSVFRHAVNAKRRALKKNYEERWSISNAIFSRGIQDKVTVWALEVTKGLQGGRAVLRLSCLVGLLLGLRDLETAQGGITQVEDEIVVALAEVMDAHAQAMNASDWEKEFQPHEQDTSLLLALILASQSLPLLPVVKLQALPLPFLSSLLTSAVSSAFVRGTFMASLPMFVLDEPLHIPRDSMFACSIQQVMSTPVMESIAGLSKLTALILGILVDSPDPSFQEAGEAFEVYRQMAQSVEQDWRRSKLSIVVNDEEIAPDTRDLVKTIWLLLKTLLFSTVMVAEGVLENIIFSKPPHSRHQDKFYVTARSLAESVLRTLFHLSFVVSQFGGVTVTAAGETPGFSELRKVFYLAIDIFTSGELDQTSERGDLCEQFVRGLIHDVRSSCVAPDHTTDNIWLFKQTKTAYALGCIEQVVSLLPERCLKHVVWDFCVPYLADPSHRETFESAHSVILAIFASHAQQQQRHLRPVYLSLSTHHPERRITHRTEMQEIKRHEQAADRGSSDLASFVPRMVPFYAQCLIENSEDGYLSTPQIRLAYSALVRSASASATTFSPPTHGSFELAWYCVELILIKIQQLALEEAQSVKVQERLHCLRLALISTVPSLPLSLMIRVLDEIRDIIRNVGEPHERKELIDALFAEILEAVGDQEKEASMRWWYTNLPSMAQADGVVAFGERKSDAGPDDQLSTTRTASHL